MSANPSSQNRGRVAVLFAPITVLAVYFIVRLVFDSARPEYYYEYRGVRWDQFTYPYFGVAFSIGLLVVEAILLAFVLTRRFRFGWLWLRGTLCLGVLLPFAFIGILGAMHAPPYYALHVSWMLAVAVCILLLVLASADSSLYHKFRGRG